MKFLITQILLFILSVGMLLYLMLQSFFVPQIDSVIDWYNVASTLALIFLLIQSFISLSVFIAQKLIAYGRREFPNHLPALRWGLGVALVAVISLLLGIYSIISPVYAFISLLAILIFVNIIFF